MNFKRAGGEAYRPQASAANRSTLDPSIKNRLVEATYFARARNKNSSLKNYFDDDDEEDRGGGGRPPPQASEEEEEDPLDAFMRANPLGESEGGSTSSSKKARVEEDTKRTKKEEQEVDPLDAFMAGVQTKVKEESKTIGQKDLSDKPEFLDEVASDEEDENGVTYATRRGAGGADDEDYDSDAEVYAAGAAVGGDDGRDALDQGLPTTYSRVGPDGKKVMEVLEPLDHRSINYPPFKKNFYTEHMDVSRMWGTEMQDYRDELQLKATGRDVPRPIISFIHAGFSDTLLKEIIKRGFEAPTAIQAQALPAALSGRDIIGIAKTGSGKTLAFVWPAIVHLMDQRELESGDGPIVVIMAPTRELASQIYVEATKFAKPHGAKVAAVFGGAGKWEQQKLLKEGVEILVATPGRLIDMIKNSSTNMRRCTMLILDEADRMFDLGFEAQIRSVIGQIRPDRQTLLFSATFKKRVERLAQDILRDPIRIVVGTVGQANEDIRQEVIVLKDNSEKWTWLVTHLERLVSAGKVLIFVSSKQGCDELAANLLKHGQGRFPCECIHGDKDQNERSAIIKKFKHGQVPILVATDVASRGLDIKDINNVINFDVAKNIEIHIHRIGRTGRMNIDGVHPGTAYTMVTQKDINFAGDLIHNLEVSKQTVPPELRVLASRRSVTGHGGGGGGSYSSSQSHNNKPVGGIGFAGSSGSGRGGGGNRFGAVAPPSAGIARGMGIGPAAAGRGGMSFVRPASEGQVSYQAPPPPLPSVAAPAAAEGGERKRKSRWD